MSQPDPVVAPGQPPPKKKGGCMGCSWACIIPAGCLGLLFLGCGGWLTMAFGIPYYTVMNSHAYSSGVAKAKEHAAVKNALGTPVVEGIPSTVKFSNNVIEYKVSLTGPKGSGTLHAIATENDSKPTFTTMELETKDKSYDLLNLPEL